MWGAQANEPEVFSKLLHPQMEHGEQQNVSDATKKIVDVALKDRGATGAGDQDNSPIMPLSGGFEGPQKPRVISE